MTLEACEWGPDGQAALLTPTHKLRRRQLLGHYNSAVKGMYSQMSGNQRRV